jgi:hypothetical protein
MPRRTRPCRAEDDNHRPKQVKMPFSPNTRRSDEDEACNSNPQQVVARQQCYIGEGSWRWPRGAGFGRSVVEKHECEGVCGQQRREGGSDDAAEAEDCGY